MSDHNPQTLHEYDGICEYDNPLPAWWTWIFWGTFVFSIFYYFHYHMGMGASVEEKYETSVAVALEKQLAHLGDIGPDTPSIIKLSQDEAMMTAIGGLFRGNCAQCHGNDGGGSIGPNLTDEAWKNIQTPVDIFTSINEGIPGTSMPAWGNRLREPQMIMLAAYVTSLRGTTPATAKEPEGSQIPPWPTLQELGINEDPTPEDGAAPE